MPANEVERSNLVIQAQPDFSEIRTHWRLLFAAMLGSGLGFPAMAFYSIGIFAPVLASEFGWSFANIFGGLAIVPPVLFFGGPLVGHLVDKYGARQVAAISLAGLGVSYASLALSSGSIVQYYATWAALALTGLGATPTSLTRAVSGAFIKQRGLALGIALSGVGLFVLCVKPLAAWLIDVAGWRVTIAVVGALPLTLGVPAVLWGFPRARSASSVAANEALRVAASNEGLTLSEALHARAFWIMCLAFVAIAFALAAPLPNIENILRSLHVSPSDIVMLSSLIGITTVAGRLAGGWLIDRTWAPLVGATVLSAAAFAFWILSQQTVNYRDAMLAVFLLGFAAGVEVDLLSYLVARYIGVRSYGVVYGTIFGLFSIGAGFGPTLLGHAFDRTGSYSQAMQICVLLLIIAACLLITLGRYPVYSADAVTAPKRAAAQKGKQLTANS